MPQAKSNQDLIDSSSARVSVIMPAFNCARFIGQALESVLSQDYDPIEVIVIDDGSTDDTGSIARGFGSRVKVFEQQNLGPAEARNFAIAKATGEYLAFLDADDVWLPGKLKAQIAFFSANPAAAIVYTRFIPWKAGKDGKFAAPTSVPWTAAPGLDHELSGWIYPQLLLDSHIHIITAVIRRRVFETVGAFDGRFGRGSDYDFWLRASRQYQAFRLSRDGALYRIHAGGISARTDPVCAQYEILRRTIAKFGYAGPRGKSDDVSQVRRHLSKICLAHAYSHLQRGDAGVSCRFFCKAIYYGNWAPKTLAYVLLSAAKTIFWARA